MRNGGLLPFLPKLKLVALALDPASKWRVFTVSVRDKTVSGFFLEMAKLDKLLKPPTWSILIYFLPAELRNLLLVGRLLDGNSKGCS